MQDPRTPDRGARKVIELDDGDHGIVCLCEWDGRQWVVIDDNYDRRIAVHPSQPTKRRMSIAIRILAIAISGALATQGGWLSVSFIFGLFLGCALGMVEAAE